MDSDSIINTSVSAFSKDLGKKKRTNRTAKLKQCKLDARREQWLSQVKNKGCMEVTSGRAGTPPSSFPVTDERNRSLENLETRSRGEENEGSSLHDSDLEFLANSSTSSISGGNCSRKDRPGSSSGSITSHSSSGCCSGSVSEEEGEKGDEEGEKGDGCLDDWEALADALTVDENRHNQPNLEPQAESKNPVGCSDPTELPSNESSVSKTELKGSIPRASENCRAWRPDDAFRPQSLPNLSKQRTFPMNADRYCGHGPVTWACHSFISQPSSCPICYEDLDLTDSSFLPCSCGFRLCLFCHKRILEADGRCPGCRKQYDRTDGEAGANGGVPAFRLSRSCSMNTRSF